MAEQPTLEQIDRMAQALGAGRKIEAIRVYREATGKGLKESKEFIDALIPKLIEQDPERYAKIAVPPGKGCATALLLMAIAMISVVLMTIEFLSSPGAL